MLNSRTFAMAAAIAILSFGSHAGAYTIDVSTAGPSGGNEDLGTLGNSDTIVLVNTVTTTAGESFNAWQWSIACAGCVVTGYTYNEFAPALMWWNNQVYGAPQPLFGIPGNVTGIGGDGSDWVGAGTFTVGFVTIHVTGEGGANVFLGGGEGFGASLGGTVLPTALNGATWVVPEPGTAMLLALGLSGLGIMGRRNS
jgi:hypothetical protein